MSSSLAMAVRSAIFGVRNADKVEHGEVGRTAPAVGQAKRVVDYVHTLDERILKTSQAAVDALGNTARNEKVLKYAGKFVKFAERNINPLICVSSGIEVLRAKDKESALVKNTAALSAMFLAEHLMKEHLGDIPKIRGVEKIANSITSHASKYKFGNKLGPIASGVVFVVGSCSAYGAGKKFGQLLLGEKPAKTNS